MEAALQLLEDCADRRAKLVITGVGKSGIVARKIAATFSSIGLMAIYLNPLDALHGDLGVVASDDVALLLSNSGETEELLEILPHLRRRGSRPDRPGGAAGIHPGPGLRCGAGRFGGPGGLSPQPGPHRQHRGGDGDRRCPGHGVDGTTWHLPPGLRPQPPGRHRSASSSPSRPPI